MDWENKEKAHRLQGLQSSRKPLRLVLRDMVYDVAHDMED